MPKRIVSTWRRMPELKRGYIVAGATVLAATIVSLVLRDYLSRSMFILFAAPVTMAAWYAGRGPALAAIALGVVAANFVFLERTVGIVPTDARDSVAIGVFVLVGLMIVHLTSLIRQARESAQNYARQLEEQGLEMELQQAELEEQVQEAQTLSEQLEEAHYALKSSTTAQLAEAQALARLGSWEWDITSNAITWSDELFRLYGLEPGSIRIDFDTFQSLVHPEDRDTALDVVNQALQTGEPFTFDHRVIRPDGSQRIFHARGKVVSDGTGKPVRMLGTGQDVTESRRAEAALRAATEYAAKQETAEAAARHLNRVFAQAPILIAVLRGAGHTFELVNDKAIEMIGEPEMLGRSVREVLPNVTAQGFGDLLDEVYRSGVPFVGREMFVWLGPAETSASGYFNFVFQPLFENEEVYAVLVVAHEVTDLVKARIAAEDAQREAVAASRAKSDFLARMSHELRTPLAAIIGYGELLSDGITGPVNDEQKKQLTRIRVSADHLLSIIDEILALARVEAGKEKVDLREVDVAELLESVASMAEPLAAGKGLSFTLETIPDIRIETDQIKLRQALLNLISNAVKYTYSGEIVLSGETRNGEIDFTVRDTGVGIAEDHLEKIFEPFWQVEQTTTRRAGGTGLGLAVTRQFVELLGGAISVQSELGRGSTFRITLPRS